MAAVVQSEPLANEEWTGRTAMHWIDGQWVDSREHGESINPATAK